MLLFIKFSLMEFPNLQHDETHLSFSRDFSLWCLTLIPRCRPQLLGDDLISGITGVAILQRCADQGQVTDRLWLRTLVERGEDIGDAHPVADPPHAACGVHDLTRFSRMRAGRDERSVKGGGRGACVVRRGAG